MPIALHSFSGEVPRAAASLLPETAAQQAIDCDFAHGDLRPLKGLFPLRVMTNAVQSLYTQEGINFFTWIYDVNAIKSPVVADQFGRVYYTGGSDFRVTQYSNAWINGGEPSTSWRAGVPKGLSISASAVERNILPDDVVLAWKFFYEANGLKYQEQTVNPTTIRIGREYQFTAPLMTTLVEGADQPDPPPNDTIVTTTADAFKATPSDAIPCVSVRGINPAGSEVFHAFSSNSVFADGNDTARFNGLDVELSVSAGGSVTIKFNFGGGFLQTRAFVYTCVNIFGEEGAPCDPVLLTYDIMQTPNLFVTLAGTQSYVPLAKYKLYGTVTASTGDADYQFIQDIPLGGGISTFVLVTTKPENWGDVIISKSWEPPKTDLKGLTLLPNGIAVAFRANEIHFSQPYRPWAWRPQDIITLPFGVVSIVAHGGQTVVTTTAHPYVISGTLPESMMERKLDAVQAGVSKNSLVSCGTFVAFATNDGICTISVGSATMDMSFSKFAREDWRNRYSGDLANLRLAFHDGGLIGYFASRNGFVWRFDEEINQFTQSTIRGDAGFMLPQTDSLYLSQGSTVFQYQGGIPLATCYWESKDFISPHPVNFGAAQIVCEAPATVTVYADGVLKKTQAVSAGVNTFRLSSGFLARKWKFGIAPTGTVNEMYLALTMGELASV